MGYSLKLSSYALLTVPWTHRTAVKDWHRPVQAAQLIIDTEPERCTASAFNVGPERVREGA
jgi:hypothetical protein